MAENSLQQILNELKSKGFILNLSYSDDGWHYNGTFLKSPVIIIKEYWCCPYTDEIIQILCIEAYGNIKGLGLLY